MLTENKNNRTKAKILTRVLPLFLVNNYESITIALMEDATRITRGTIYRYFENKEDVFNQAIVQYYDSPLNVLFSLKPEQHTLESYWKLKIQQLKSAYEYLREYDVFTDALAISHYIEMQAIRINPSFNDIVISHKHKNLKYWSLVLRNTPNFTLNTNNISYQNAGQIYYGAYLQLCSFYPKMKLDLPNLVFP